MKNIEQVARMQQIAGIREGISPRVSKLIALQEGDDMQEIFNDWVEGQNNVDNIIHAEFPEELEGDNKIYWEKYLELIEEFPDSDREDISSAISAVYFADLPFASLAWNDEQTARDVYDSIKPDNSIQEDVEPEVFNLKKYYPNATINDIKQILYNFGKDLRNFEEYDWEDEESALEVWEDIESDFYYDS